MTAASACPAIVGTTRLAAELRRVITAARDLAHAGRSAIRW